MWICGRIQLCCYSTTLGGFHHDKYDINKKKVYDDGG